MSALPAPQAALAELARQALRDRLVRPGQRELQARQGPRVLLGLEGQTALMANLVPLAPRVPQEALAPLARLDPPET